MALVKGPTAQRFVFLDAVRAFAALGVVLHHALSETALHPTLRKVLPTAIWRFDAAIGFRVPTLFLLSGFFAAYVLRNSDQSPRSLARVLGRRQVRLALPYWAMLVVGVALVAIANLSNYTVNRPFPRVSDVLAHLVYLQYIVPERREILVVAWSLCIDFQFYLVFIFILMAVRWLFKARMRGEDACRFASYAVVGVLGIVTLIVARGGAWGNAHGWFAPHWHLFAAGALTCRSLVGGKRDRWLWTFSFVPLGIGLWTRDPVLFAPAALAISIVLIGRCGKLTEWGGSRAIRYLSARSFSLYLLHFPIVWNVQKLGYKVTGDNLSAAVVWFCGGIALSLPAAHLFHALVEAPSTRLASRIFARRDAAATRAPQRTRTPMQQPQPQELELGPALPA